MEGMSTARGPRLSVSPSASCSCCCCDSNCSVGGYCSSPPASSAPPCLCGCSCCCCCSSTCGGGPYAGCMYDEPQVHQVNAIFSAAEAALQAFWRSSIARVVVSVESAGSEAAYCQVKTAARSQAAASIAWILGAASVVLKEDLDQVDENMFDSFYPRRRPAGEDRRYFNNLRRDVSRSNGHYNNNNNNNNGDGIINSSRHRSRPRWEWRPVITNPPASPSFSLQQDSIDSTSHDTKSATSSTARSSMAVNPLDSASSALSISSLLIPSLISCRIADTPYNNETFKTELDIIKTNETELDISKTNEAAASNVVEQSQDQSKLIIDNNHLQSHSTKAWMTPSEEITIDIIDGQNHVSHTSLQSFSSKDDQEETILCTVPPTPENKNAESSRACEAINSSTCTSSVEGKRPDCDELSSSQASKNHKKHLKKKQRRASANHL